MYGPDDRQDKNKDECRINKKIKASSVRCIDHEGNQVGIIATDAALALADQHNLDLVEVAPGADPPVCRIMDYGKYKYQKSKRSSSKPKQKGAVIKEVKFRPKVDVHDYNFKRNHVERFLKAGAKVKVTIMFRGREMAHTDKGREILERVATEMAELARVERDPRLEGRNMFMILSPK
jgi:translation initiation factor IF-3